MPTGDTFSCELGFKMTTKQMTIANQPYTTTAEGYIPYPIEVTAGGATVFVLDVEQFHKF